MIGMKPPKKVMIASTNAMGTPSTTRPRPMKSASTKETAAWALKKPPTVFQIRAKASVRCMPAVGPATLRIQGPKRSPSLRMKKVNTRVITIVTTMDPTVIAPLITPPAIWSDCSCNQALAWSTYSVTCSLCRFKGGPESQSSTTWSPSPAWLTMISPWLITVGAMATKMPMTVASDASRTVTAANAAGQPWSLSQVVIGQRMVETRMARSTGRTPTHN